MIVFHWKYSVFAAKIVVVSCLHSCLLNHIYSCVVSHNTSMNKMSSGSMG